MADTRKRNRFKSILEDRDTQITNLKIECDMSRSQHVQATKEEEEDLKQKHKFRCASTEDQDYTALKKMRLAQYTNDYSEP